MTTRVGTTRLASISSMMASINGISASDSPSTAQALQLIDGERVSSVPSLVSAFEQKRESITTDRNLSEHGKREQIRAAADSTIGNIASRAMQLIDLEAAHTLDRNTAVPLPPATVNDTLIDLALAAHVKSLELIPSRLVDLPERLRVAVARTPSELSGLKPEVHARVHGSLMSAAKAAQLASEAQVLDAARKVTQAAITEVGSLASWTPQQWATHFGAGKWNLPGVTDSMAQRLAAGGE